MAKLHRFFKPWLSAISLAVGSMLFAPPSVANEITFTAQNSVVYPISGNLPDLKFSLESRDHQIITEKDVAGKIVLLFFGYAHCPDICPLTLAQLTMVMKKMGPAAAKQMRIVFISVDPKRDTPDLVQNYVDSFRNGAIGLSGSEKAIQDIARRYRVSYQIESPKDGANTLDYEVMHARGIYVFDQKGKARFLASDADDPAPLIKALETLIN